MTCEPGKCYPGHDMELTWPKAAPRRQVSGELHIVCAAIRTPENLIKLAALGGKVLLQFSEINIDHTMN